MLRFFLVEDNPIIRDGLIATLAELLGAVNVGSTDNEHDAKAWFATPAHEWELAIVDLFLKQGSGINVVAALRRRPIAQKLVVLSNYASPEVRVECLRLGADKVFDKTSEIEYLIDFCKSLAPVRSQPTNR